MKVPAARICFPEEDRAEILSRIGECLATGQLTLGAYGRQLEEAFSRFMGGGHVVAVSSGTSALEIALRILGVQGKEVLVPTNTFFATPASVIHAGGRVKFIDTDPDTLSLDIEHVKRAITPETAGVIVVHIGGLVTPRMEELISICNQAGLFVLEDAAHAHGSSAHGRVFDVAASSSYST